MQFYHDLIILVCIIFNRKPKKVDGPRNTKVDSYWDEIRYINVLFAYVSRVLFADSHLLSKMLDFNKDSITDKTIEKLQPYLKETKFTPSAMEKIALAAGMLACIVTNDRVFM